VYNINMLYYIVQLYLKLKNSTEMEFDITLYTLKSIMELTLNNDRQLQMIYVFQSIMSKLNFETTV